MPSRGETHVDILLREGKDLDEAEKQLQEILTIDPKQKRARDRLMEVQEKRKSFPI